MTQSWHDIEIEKVLSKLESYKNGLSEEESRKRLTQYGPNELEKPEKISPLRIFAEQLTNILIILLLAATVLSVIIGEMIDAIAILAIVIVAAILGFTQEYRAERAIEALKKMLTPVATVIRDSNEKEILAKEIVPGDAIVLESGDKIPADARVIEVFSLQVNEASLTGESVPVEKQIEGLNREIPVADRKNMVFAGTTVTDGKGTAIVVSTGMNTEFGKIAKGVAVVEKGETPLEKRMGGVGKLLSKLMVGACFFVVATGVIREYLVHGVLGLDFALEMIMFGVALAVAAVPEALPAIVTGTLAIGMREMAKRNAIVRKMPAVETLGSTSVICTDKTGTLTKGEMTVRRIYDYSKLIDVSGVGFEPKGEFRVNGKKFNSQEDHVLPLLLKAASLCNEANLIKDEEGWRIRGDPTEGALIVAAAKSGYSQDQLKKEYPRIYEIPFSSERKRMTTVHKTPKGKFIVFMKGAPETVLNYCTKLMEHDKENPLTEEKKRKILEINDEMANSALRVLGVAYKRSINEQDEGVYERDLVFLGLIGMIDPPREEAIEAINTCKRVMMKPIMITGDQMPTALSIAKEMGIYEDGDIALTGAELEETDEEEFHKIFDRVTVYARVSPLHKLRIVKAWKEKGEVVSMTGDGVNDAPALRKADIGVAMGITGTEVSKEASDMVIADDNFASIVKAVERGRWIYDNIKKYILYLLESNIVELIVLGAAVLMGFPLPLLPVQILYINLATDGLPAIALGIGPADPDIMKKPPRGIRESIFTKDGKIFLVVYPIIASILLLLLFVTSMDQGVTVARTRIFMVLVFLELAIALTFRSLRYSVLNVKPGRVLSLAVIITAIQTAILIAIPATRNALKIAVPTLADIGVILVICMIGVITIETLKRILKNI